MTSTLIDEISLVFKKYHFELIFDHVLKHVQKKKKKKKKNVKDLLINKNDINSSSLWTSS